MKSIFFIITSIVFLNGCSYVNVDKIELNQPAAIEDGASIVIIRGYNSQADTEASIVNCLGKHIRNANSKLQVLNERKFIDSFYPWFEPSVAPTTPEKLEDILSNSIIAENIQQLNLDYLIWLQGSTQLHDDKVAMACSLNGCLGFASWKNSGNYEAIIWELDRINQPKITPDDLEQPNDQLATRLEIGRVSTDASGTSYLPAFVIPIPILARVQAKACKGMGRELAKFFVSNSASE